MFCCQVTDAYYTECPECPDPEPPSASCSVYPECPEPAEASDVYPECPDTPSSGSQVHGSPKRFAYALTKPMLLVNPRWMRAPSGPEDKSSGGGGESSSGSALDAISTAYRTYSVATTTLVLTQLASPQPRPARSWSCPSLLVSRQQAEEPAAGAASSVLCQCVGFCCCVARGAVPYSIGSY